ncbi:transglutaminase-like domain-containing protein [Microbacterium sp.]|uniref:transglutaminase-like domain-containing protein n=1 Tax=Microbacterium sp. TaxID=51671 RepID=UPI0025DBC555|nr:transglutaminase-like domain-containing protein [Microbacterium sp.]
MKRVNAARVTAGSVYVGTSVLLAAVAAWPIYRTGAFLVLVVTAALLAAGIVALVTWRGWGGWAAAGVVAAVLALTGVPLAVPGSLGGPSEMLRGLGELGAGVVVGWKDLLTVQLPVGSYRNLLVPALVVFLVGTTVALRASWRADARAMWAVAVSMAMVGFGLLFGRTDVSAPLEAGPLTLPAPVETGLGVVWLVTGILWLSWRARDERVRALSRAAESTGVRTQRIVPADTRRVMLGVGIVAACTAGVGLTVPAAVASVPRTVLRDATGPRVEISREISPLASYRTLFADAAVDQVLFQATGEDPPDRLRLAVLDSYDGAVFRTDATTSGAPFVRVPAARDAGAGAVAQVEVAVGALAGIWMPSAGSLSEAVFDGPRAVSLADGFYYSPELSAAVQTATWAPGDSYAVRAALLAPPPLAGATAPGDLESAVVAPASLRTWVREHAAGTGGAALEGLVELLRTRGYLSHALTGADGGAMWMRDLGDYRFVSSASGHSLARIDEMFTALAEREADPRAAATDNYVAAVGDDEQFATAVALIAGELGFPARVVVGVRLSSTDAGVSVCANGACRSGDVSAWVEVRAATGEWIPVDVTPQHAQAPGDEVTEQPDPTIGTAVRPITVDEIEPPKPAQEDAAGTPEPDRVADLGWVWAVLRIAAWTAGILAAVVGPFLLVIAAKALRRRRRRTAQRPADRVAGGWDEYLDAAVDAGHRVPAASTRTEIAALHGTRAAATLAASADEAVFSATTIDARDADDFWRIVDAERRALAPGLWARVRAAVSLRSIVPPGRLPAPLIERGSRVSWTPRRTT